MSDKKFIEVPNLPGSNCFACGPANDQGLKMKFFFHDSIVFCNIAIPEYMVGWRTIAHGGILSTLLDETMSWGAIVLLRKYILTKSMTINYHRPVLVNEVLRIESEIKEHISDREGVMIGKIFNSKGELCVSSIGHFALMDKDYIKKLALVDDKEIDFYWEMFESFDKEKMNSPEYY